MRSSSLAAGIDLPLPKGAAEGEVPWAYLHRLSGGKDSLRLSRTQGAFHQP
jgi:hypothetical protein